MTYGFRIHFEYYYLKQTDYYLKQAQIKKLQKTKSISYLTNVIRSFKNFNPIYIPIFLKTPLKTLKDLQDHFIVEELKVDFIINVALANIMLSCAYESLTNFLYRQGLKHLEENYDEEEAIKQIKATKSRSLLFKKACENLEIDYRKYESTISRLEDIYKSRNDIIHYKEKLTYQGHSFNTRFENIISQEKTITAYKLLLRLITAISSEHYRLNELQTITKTKYTYS